MEMGTVSTLSIVGMAVTLLISVLLPIVLCIFIRCRMKAKISSFFYGCGVFIIFALVLEQILHTIVLGVFGEAVTGNILIYGLYGGAAAALFEETGRFVTMKFFMKKNLTKENALMYGAGHGGVEAILLVGLSYISSIANAILINTNQMETVLAVLDESQKESTLKSLSVLWTTSSDFFFAAGVERIWAIMLQISLSVLVYRAVKSGEKKFLALAIGFHFLVDFIAVISAQRLSVWIIELLIFVMTAVVLAIAYRIYKEESSVKNF